VLAVLAGCDQVYGLDRDGEPCPADYLPIAGAGAYKIVVEDTRWLLADAKCKRDTATAITHLVVFEDVVELGLVREAVDAQEPWEVAVGYARDATGDRTRFTAVTGAALEPDSPLWDVGEPNGTFTDPDTNKVYEESIGLTSNFLQLFDAPPMYPLEGFVCECDGEPATETFEVE